MKICTSYLQPQVGLKKINKYLIVMVDELIDFYFNGMGFLISLTTTIHIVLGCLCNINMKIFLKVLIKFKISFTMILYHMMIGRSRKFVLMV